jgi:acetyl-CoA carboxylase biotin carboxyl carrier protein
MVVRIGRDEIITILRLVEQSPCTDFELKVGDTSLRARKRDVETREPGPQAALRARQAAAVATKAVGPIAVAPPSAPARPREFVEGFQLKAPMLGIFYRAPAPDAPPFVEVGDRVEIGTTLCIIEVMKVMNTVKADRAGVVAAIYPDNAAMVEFDETILVIAEADK